MAEILVPVTSRIVQVVGGNLFDLAATYLDDATQWNRIAKINGLWDPFILGPMALKIPAKGDDGQGGILGL
ncbi:hypothetical protein [Xanthobacter versatilis]|uniref:hypothetical protein n=1 Tax=Xanthobacter autotrophicus (strain ATCC BAA-1158 / Py2) TaxID=78245 RepID=UPI00372BB963